MEGRGFESLVGFDTDSLNLDWEEIEAEMLAAVTV